MTKTVETVHTKKTGLKNNKKAMQKAFLNIAIYQTDRINHIDRSVFCIKKKRPF